MFLIDYAEDIQEWGDFEDVTATAQRLKEVLDDLCTQPIRSVEERCELGQQFRLLASCLDDVGGSLIDGTLIVAH